jgi:putative hemolysin
MDLLELGILVFLILLNGLFALSEMAIVSSKKPRLKAMADRGSKGARAALKLLEDPSQFLSTVQIGITLIGIVAGAYGATALADDLSPFIVEAAPNLRAQADVIAFGVVIVITTFFSLVIGELVPKRVALAAPESLAASVAPMMAFLAKAAAPAVWLLRGSTEGLIRLLGMHRTSQSEVTEEELHSLIEEGAKAGVLESEEREMIHGVMRLSDRTVKAIMTPRLDIVWLDPSEARSALLAKIKESRHSRFPVATGSADDIIGVVQTKEILAALEDDGGFSIGAVMHAPMFVPASMPVFKLIEAMRGNPVRMVMVADEFGAVQGLVTAADLLEAIAGDGVLSADEAVSAPVQRDDGSWIIDGMMPIDEFETVLDVRRMADDESFTTVAGFVVHVLQRIPSVGDKAEHWPLSFEVVDMDERRVDKLIVRRVDR